MKKVRDQSPAFYYPGIDAPVELVRSRRKTIAIHLLSAQQIEVRAPLQVSRQQIDQFIRSRLNWIQRNLLLLAERPLPAVPVFQEGEQHLFLGVPRKLVIARGSPAAVILFEEQLLVRTPTPSDQAGIQRQIEKFCRTRALEVFEERIRVCLQRFEALEFSGELSVRKMKRRWGSCSSAGDICLNSLLVQRPLAAIDLVVTHELCHLRHFRHDTAFYRLLSEVMPDWRDRERLLEGEAFIPLAM
ncbi:MAG: M48 family metallopeptidase [Pseudomonadales bacterium]|nr:M48 family metallopeptidase [Pseudomonadales bacterium]